MVVRDLDVSGPLLGPHEADSALVVDLDRMLSGAVTGQLLQPVSWWDAKVADVVRHATVSGGQRLRAPARHGRAALFRLASDPPSSLQQSRCIAGGASSSLPIVQLAATASRVLPAVADP